MEEVFVLMYQIKLSYNDSLALEHVDRIDLIERLADQKKREKTAYNKMMNGGA